MGFEPMVEVSPHTRLAGERLQPARPSLHKIFRLIICEIAFQVVNQQSRLEAYAPYNSICSFWIPRNSYIKLRSNFIGGGSRIRTHGGVNLNGFQDRRFWPLSHPSGSDINWAIVDSIVTDLRHLNHLGGDRRRSGLRHSAFGSALPPKSPSFDRT